MNPRYLKQLRWRIGISASFGMLMRGAFAAILVLTCVCGCDGQRGSSSTSSVPPVLLELRTIPGYPLPGQGVEQVYLFRVTEDGRVARIIDGNAAGNAILKDAELENLRSIVGSASLTANPTITMHASSVILDVYRGKQVGSVASDRRETNSVPNKVFSKLQSLFPSP